MVEGNDPVVRHQCIDEMPIKIGPRGVAMHHNHARPLTLVKIVHAVVTDAKIAAVVGIVDVHRKWLSEKRKRRRPAMAIGLGTIAPSSKGRRPTHWAGCLRYTVRQEGVNQYRHHHR